MTKKLFLLKGLFLTLPLLLAVFFFEYRLAGIENLYSAKLALLEKDLPNTELLVLGSSHSLYAVDPQYFTQKGFNMAHVSQPLFYDLEILNKYIERMPQLKTVVLSISYFTFPLDFMHRSFPEYWRGFFYERFYGMSFPGASWLDPRKYSLIALYGNSNALLWSFKGFKTDLVRGLSSRGALYPLEKKDPGNSQQGAEHVRLHETSGKEALRPYNRELLRKIVELCEKHKVQLVLVTTPVFHTYSDHIDKTRYQEMLRDITDATGNRVPYYNFFSDGQFTVEDFNDFDHLNTEGARKFTQILDSLLNNSARARLHLPDAAATSTR